MHNQTPPLLVIDIDNTLVQDGQVNRLLIEWLIHHNHQRIYLLTHVNHSDVLTQCRNGVAHFGQVDLINALSKIGFLVQGIITPADYGIAQLDHKRFQLGAGFARFLAPLYPRIHNPAGSPPLNEENVLQDPQFMRLRGEYQNAYNQIETLHHEHHLSRTEIEKDRMLRTILANKPAGFDRVMYIDYSMTQFETLQHYHANTVQFIGQPDNDNHHASMFVEPSAEWIRALQIDFLTQNLRRELTPIGLSSQKNAGKLAAAAQRFYDTFIGIGAPSYQDIQIAQIILSTVKGDVTLQHSQSALYALRPTNSPLWIAAKTLVGALIGLLAGFALSTLMIVAGVGGIAGATYAFYNTVTCASLGGAVGFGLGFFADQRSSLHQSADAVMRTLKPHHSPSFLT